MTVRYMVMVKTAENRGPPPGELIEAMAKRAEESHRAGVLLETDGRAPSAMGARVRASGGNVTVTDGPFSEAKEVVGGYAVLEVKSKQDAIEAARWLMRFRVQHMPGREGEAEIRQLVDAEDFARRKGAHDVR